MRNVGGVMATKIEVHEVEPGLGFERLVLRNFK